MLHNTIRIEKWSRINPHKLVTWRLWVHSHSVWFLLQSGTFKITKIQISIQTFWPQVESVARWTSLKYLTETTDGAALCFFGFYFFISLKQIAAGFILPIKSTAALNFSFVPIVSGDRQRNLSAAETSTSAVQVSVLPWEHHQLWQIREVKNTGVWGWSGALLAGVLCIEHEVSLLSWSNFKLAEVDQSAYWFLQFQVSRLLSKVTFH